MRGRRTLAMVLSAMMTLSLCLTLLPRTAFAIADGDVFIGSVQVASVGQTDKQYLLANGAPGNSGNYAIEYDPTVSPAKITVKDNASISAAYRDTGSHTSFCIYSKNVDLEIYIESGKTLTLSNLSNLSTGSPTTDYDHGIYLVGANNALSVSGGGTLTVTVTGGDAKLNCYGIYAGPFTVSGNTTVTAMGGASRKESYGVCAVGKLTVDAGCSLTANAGSVSGTADDNRSSGVRCTSLEVGGTLNARGGNAGRSSYGVYSAGNLTVAAGGSLTATGGDVLNATDVECVSYGVYSTNNMTVSGTLTGTGGTVTLGMGNAYRATSAGVYAGGTLTADDGGTVTGNGGAATSQSNDATSAGVYAGGACTADNGTIDGTGGAATSLSNAAISYGVYIGGAGSVTGNNGSMTGLAGTCTGRTNNANAQSVGVHCVGSLAVGSASAAQTAALTGTGGSADTTTASASGSAASVGVRTLAPITVNEGATLTGTGDLASAATNAPKTSGGVNTNGESVTVSGTLKATGGTGLTSGTSYGVTAGGGTVTLRGSGSMTATANGTGTSESFGVQAGGITMTDNSHLIAEVKATADNTHSAKTLRDNANQNALTTGLTAVWRESKSATFASISTYTANGNEQDKASRQYLEVKNGGDGLKADPVSWNFDESTVGGTLPSAKNLTVTNTSGRDLTLTQPTLSNYTVTLPSTTLAAGASMTVSVQPKAATLNTAADYGTTVTLSESAATNPAKVEIPLAFTVNAVPTVRLDVDPQVVSSGGQVTLTATVSGGTKPYASYEWSDGTNTWTTTTKTSEVNPTVTTDYTVRVQDDNGVWSAVSGAKRVDVMSAVPVFTAHPQSQTVAVGASTYFNVGVTGNPMPTYQWQLSTDGGATWSDIRGETGISCTTPAVTAAMNGQQYRCVARNDVAPNGVPSNAATLTVTVPAPMNAPKTGDNTPLTLLVGLVLLCGAGGAVVGVRRKRLGE